MAPGQAECGGAAGTEGWPGGGYKQTHGRVLLLSDEAQIGRATVERVRRRCVEEGLERALGREPEAEAVGRSDCLGLRRTAGGPGQLDAEVVGRPAGRMRDSGEHQP